MPVYTGPPSGKKAMYFQRFAIKAVGSHPPRE
jgi:hypothetical protein